MSDTSEMFEAYVALVAKLVQEELSNLPRGVYHLSQAMKNKLEEHPNYNFLPETSILRAIIGHFLTPSRPFDLDKSLLEILANLENRPLPPFDWRLLSTSKLMNNSTTKCHLIEVLAKQALNSSSAKSILEEYLRTWSSCEVALEIMPHFRYDLTANIFESGPMPTP